MKENILAIPSKDRLNDETINLLAQSGIDIRIPGRLLSTEVSLPEVGSFTVALLRPKDIVKLVATNQIPLGIVGFDSAKEYRIGRRYSEGVNIALELGIGKCRLVFACAEDSDIKTREDLIYSARFGRIEEGTTRRTGLSIATSFPKSTFAFFENEEGRRRLFAQLMPSSEWYGIRLYELGGAVEAAPAMGMAEVISDLVETGETLEENGLREITTIFESQGVLITNASNRPGQNRLVDAITNRLSTALGQ